MTSRGRQPGPLVGSKGLDAGKPSPGPSRCLRGSLALTHVSHHRNNVARCFVRPTVAVRVGVGHGRSTVPRPWVGPSTGWSPRRGQQDELHEVAVLAHEPLEARLLLGPGEPVRTMRPQPAGRLLPARPPSGSTPSSPATTDASNPCQPGGRPSRLVAPGALTPSASHSRIRSGIHQVDRDQRTTLGRAETSPARPGKTRTATTVSPARTGTPTGPTRPALRAAGGRQNNGSVWPRSQMIASGCSASCLRIACWTCGAAA
jgi:hypothetical protein